MRVQAKQRARRLELAQDAEEQAEEEAEVVGVVDAPVTSEGGDGDFDYGSEDGTPEAPALARSRTAVVQTPPSEIGARIKPSLEATHEI